MTDREIFKNNLSELMRITKVKQADIARYAEVSYQTVSSWVCGRGYPRAEQMEKLCNFFGIRKSILIEQKGASKNSEEILLSLFRAMSTEGRNKMLERAEEMAKLYPKRTKTTRKKKVEVESENEEE